MSKKSEVKDDLRYSKDHEWVKSESGTVTLGITAFAVEQLGDVTLVNWDVEIGDSIEAGEVFGTVESVKALSDLMAPLSGVVKKLNDYLEDAPENLNDDCWGAGWMMEIEPRDSADIDGLLSPDEYRDHIAAEED